MMPPNTQSPSYVVANASALSAKDYPAHIALQLVTQGRGRRTHIPIAERQRTKLSPQEKTCMPS